MNIFIKQLFVCISVVLFQFNRIIFTYPLTGSDLHLLNKALAGIKPEDEEKPRETESFWHNLQKSNKFGLFREAGTMGTRNNFENSRNEKYEIMNELLDWMKMSESSLANKNSRTMLKIYLTILLNGDDIEQDAMNDICSAEVRKAISWTRKYLQEELLAHTRVLENLGWKFNSNLTDYNEEISKNFSEVVQSWKLKILPQAKRFLLNRDAIESCDNSILKQLDLFVTSSSVISRNQTVRKMLRDLSATLEKTLAEAYVVRNNSDPLTSNFDGEINIDGIDLLIFKPKPDVSNEENNNIDQGQSTDPTLFIPNLPSAGSKKYFLEKDLTPLMANSRDYDLLTWAWRSWHDTPSAEQIRNYLNFIELENQQIKAAGFKDISDFWLWNDYKDQNMESEMDGIIQEIMPLYKQLHAYVRNKLALTYPGRQLGNDGLIPVHVLGNMFALKWSSIPDITTPFHQVSPPNITQYLVESGANIHTLIKMSESFYVSLGFEPMTREFWKNSIFVKPENVSMVCHASAWDFFTGTDYRIKMCGEPNEIDLYTAFHEMGHVAYFASYRNQVPLFRTGANAAVHEAVGDTIAMLAATENYHIPASKLKLSERKSKNVKITDDSSKNLSSSKICEIKSEDEIELLRKNNGKNLNDEYVDAEGEQAKMNRLMQRALESIPLITYAYVLEKWRFELMQGKIENGNYNERYWQLNKEFRGLKPPVPRTNDNFDPLAKYHIPANVPYSRYMLASIIVYQFHESLCLEAGFETDQLSDCTIFGQKGASRKFRRFLSAGSSKPWRHLLEELTGYPGFNAKPLLSFFQPLAEFLKKENDKNPDMPVGW